MSIASIQSKYPSAIWFDSNYVGTNSGTVDEPYSSITTAISNITSNDNVIAVKNGTHSISPIGGTATSSNLSLGGTADTLTLVGESTEAVLSHNTSANQFGTLINLKGVALGLKLETIKGLDNATRTYAVIYGGNDSSYNITIDQCILEMGSTLLSAASNYGFFRSDGSSTLTIKNSLIIGASTNPGSGLIIGSTGGFTTFDCQGNTIINASGSADDLSSISSFSSSTFKNNIFIGTGSNSEVLGFTPATASNNCYHNTGISSGSGGVVFADPLFVDSANGDYRLRPSSPCIGAGTAS